MLRNLIIAERLGCLNANGLEEMKRGKSPTVLRGPYSGRPAVGRPHYSACCGAGTRQRDRQSRVGAPATERKQEREEWSAPTRFGEEALRGWPVERAGLRRRAAISLIVKSLPP